ncbi:MAG: SOS response-associated peptidase [Deltaproteobacteria bacterium]|nr:SOS response-associated peptidase [Deltaproteobacteria bacterium]
MCGRFTLTTADVDALARELAARVDEAHRALYRPRWNAAPTDACWMVREGPAGRELLPARFGFSAPGRPALINARAETAPRLPAFRRPFAEARCLVPVDGFYEWVDEDGGRRPRWLHRTGGGLLLLAGLWREEAGGPAFVLLTTPANALVSGLHGRMPAILAPEQADAWLARPDPSLLVPAPEDWLVATPVGSRVNSVLHDDPGCLAPPAPRRQGTLF